MKIGQKGTEDGQFRNPFSLTCSSRGDIIVADSGNHRIQVFDETGKLLLKFGSQGRANGQFSHPTGITFDHRNHQIVVADQWNHRIQIFDEKGTFIRTFGSYDNIDGQFVDPKSVAVMSNLRLSGQLCERVWSRNFDFSESFVLWTRTTTSWLQVMKRLKSSNLMEHT